MIDSVQIEIISGNGGNGVVSGRHEKYIPKGGPDGGDGGDGGSIFVSVDANMNTLSRFRNRHRFVAENGGHGSGALRHGKQGADVEIGVPVGTVVSSGARRLHEIADLAGLGQRECIAKGGRGGRGNARFASPTNRFPLLSEQGEAGEQLRLRLDLKLLADVGIVGAPNAGKSSLLAAVTSARPKIADYPFTTLEPVLGVVDWREGSFVMVDIPGLIEGAHSGAGLGHEFLRHVERTRVLVHVVDCSAEDPLEDYRRINDELGMFDGGLLTKPQVVALNKVDVAGAREGAGTLKSTLSEKGVQGYSISAVARDGLDSLLDGVLHMLEDAGPGPTSSEESQRVSILRPKPRDEKTSVRLENGTYVVDAPAAGRIAAMVDPHDWSARTQFYGHLKKIGVVKALERAGVAPGDTVKIGKVEWEWD